MKLKNLFILVLIASFAILASCKKDEEKPEEKETIKWTNASVSDNKKEIENDGIALLNEMKAMEDEPAMETNASFVSFLDMSDPFEGNNGVTRISLHNDYIFRINYSLANYDGNSVSDIFKSISLTSFKEDPETVQEFYDELVGIYSWIPIDSNGYWEYIQTGNVIKFEFPSTENGETNDASYTITFEAYTGTVLDPELEGNLPTKVSAELKVGSALYLGYYLDVTYNTDGYPTSIITSLVVGEFKFEAMASNTNNTAFETSYTFTHSNNILMQFSLAAGGNWTEDNIRDNIHYYVQNYNPTTGEYTWVEVTKDEYYDSEEFQVWKVVTEGNAHFQVMNLKIVGQVDIEGLGDVMDAMDYDEYGLDEASEEADAINDYVTLSLRFTDTDEVIAMAEAYGEEYERKDTYTYWDWELQQEVEVTEYHTDYRVNLRFVFADGSKIDFETYINEGFAQLEDQITDFLEELKNTYGSDEEN